MLSFDLSRVFKNPWSFRRDPIPEISTAADVFKKPVPEVAPELLRSNNILKSSQTSGYNNSISNSKTRHRQNRKSKSSSNSPIQNNSKFSPKTDKRRNKSASVEPLTPLSWPIHPPEVLSKPLPPIKKPADDDKVDTASASSTESSRSRGSSVSSENKESDRKKKNDDENSKFLR